MSNLDSLETFDAKDFIKENPGVMLKGGGIDRRDLCNQKDVHFELDTDRMEDNDDNENVYFDKEKHFQQVKISFNIRNASFWWTFHVTL